MAIHRITALWTGFVGAPGYTNFHFMAGGGLISDAQQSADRVTTFLSGISAYLPSVVNLQIQPDVEVIDEDTGEITEFQTIDPGDSISGGASGDYSAPSGAVINWRTNDVRFNRRIRGRTFIVPLDGGSYDSDGTLDSTAHRYIQQSANGLVGGDLDSELVVWSRPRDGSGGVAATVVQANVPDKAAILRSRRD